MGRLLVLLSLIAVPARAWAQQDAEDPGVMVAIENREFRLKHELTLSPGILPLDAFYKGLSGQVSYTYHFSDFFAWQVGRAAYSYNVSTNLRNQLTQDFGAQAQNIQEVNWIVGSDVLWTPFYGKVAFMNLAVIHLELFLAAGASALGINGAVAPAARLGGGLRVFLGQGVSLRLDVGNDFVIAATPLNVMDVDLGLAFNFGGR